MNHRNLPERKHWLWLAVVVAILVLGVMIIRPPAWATPMSVLQDATHQAITAPEIADASLQQVSVDEQTSAEGAPHSTMQADTPSSDNCIACHTDKKKLKAVAEEPEEVKSEEASGEG